MLVPLPQEDVLLDDGDHLLLALGDAGQQDDGREQGGEGGAVVESWQEGAQYGQGLVKSTQSLYI